MSEVGEIETMKRMTEATGMGSRLTIWQWFKRDNGRDHRVATNKLNIKIRDNRDFGASHGYHGSLWDGLLDHRARLNQRLVPGALRPRR